MASGNDMRGELRAAQGNIAVNMARHASHVDLEIRDRANGALVRVWLSVPALASVGLVASGASVADPEDEPDYEQHYTGRVTFVQGPKETP